MRRRSIDPQPLFQWFHSYCDQLPSTPAHHWLAAVAAWHSTGLHSLLQWLMARLSRRSWIDCVKVDRWCDGGGCCCSLLFFFCVSMKLSKRKMDARITLLFLDVRYGSRAMMFLQQLASRHSKLDVSAAVRRSDHSTLHSGRPSLTRTCAIFTYTLQCNFPPPLPSLYSSSFRRTQSSSIPTPPSSSNANDGTDSSEKSVPLVTPVSTLLKGVTNERRASMISSVHFSAISQIDRDRFDRQLHRE